MAIPRKRRNGPAARKATPQPAPVPDLTHPLAIVDTRAGMRWGSATRPRYNPDDLAGRKGLRIYDEMMRDEQVRACLGLKVAAIIGPGWALEPGDESEAAQTVAEQVETDLRELPGPVEDALEGILSALAYGFSLTEQIWSLDSGRLKLARLQPIAPHDVVFVQDAYGSIEAIRQLSMGNPEPMPPGKFIHFVNGAFANFANPFGTSDLRAAHQAWFHKTHWVQWLAIYGEKLADAPIVSRHPKDTPAAKITSAQSVLENLQARTVLSVPEGWEVELLGTGQRSPRNTFIDAIEHYNLAVAKALLIPDKLGIVGGAVQAGSLALSKTQMGAFFFVIEILQRRVEACVNEQLIKRMAQFAMPTAPVPRFRLMPIAQDDRLAIVQAWYAAVAGGMPETADDLNHTRQLLDYPEVEDAALERMMAERQAKADAMTQAVREGNGREPGGGSSGNRGSRDDTEEPDAAKLAFDPSKHPRHPEGTADVVGDTKRDGGKFAPKNGVAAIGEALHVRRRGSITDTAYQGINVVRAGGWSTYDDADAPDIVDYELPADFRLLDLADPESIATVRSLLETHGLLTQPIQSALDSNPDGLSYLEVESSGLDSAARQLSQLGVLDGIGYAENDDVPGGSSTILVFDGVKWLRPIGDAAKLSADSTPVGEAPFWRPLRENESRLDFASKRRTFEAESAALGAVLGDVATRIVADVTDRVRRTVAGGLDARDVAGLHVSPEVTQTNAGALRAQLRKAYGEGRRDGARDAVATMKPGVRLSAQARDCLQAMQRVDLADGLIGTAAQQYFEAKSFWVTGVLEDDILSKAKAVLFNALKAAPTVAPSLDVILANLAEVLQPYIPVTDAAGRTVNVPHRLETIARTNSAEAVNEGRWSTFTDPDLEGIIETLEYSAILDDRVRDNHRAWDGVQRPPDFWVGPPDRRPLNGFNCRCILSPVILDAQPTETLPDVEVVDPGFK